jgi:ADP-ribosylglycohydrolase
VDRVAVELLDGVYGVLVGGAIGDALGAPVENWHHTDIRREHGRVEEFLPQPARSRDGAPGQITDDSTLRHYLCQAIVDKGGRITPPDYARVWLEKLNADRLFVTERIVLEKLRLGMNPWDTGRGQLAADAAIMAIAPVGIINAGDPGQAYQDAVCLAALHQDGLERDAAAATAAGIAAALVPGATVDSVVGEMRRLAGYEVRRLIDAGTSLATSSSGAEEMVERFYATLLDATFPTPPDQEWDPQRSVAATSREVLPAVTATLAKHPDDPREALVVAAGIGRDADTIASVVGTFVGALHGASALPRHWVDQSERANADFFAEATGAPTNGFRAMAERMVQTLHRHRDTVRQRSEQLDALLHGA